MLYLLLFLIACIPVPVHEKLFSMIDTIKAILDFKNISGFATYLLLTGLAAAMVGYGTFSHVFIQNNRGHYSWDFNRYVIEHQ